MLIIATISTQRSGTKFLGSCFKSGTSICPFGEIFNPENEGVGSFRAFLRAQPRFVLEGASDKTLDAFFSSFANAFGIIHFDIMYNNLEAACTGWNGFSTYFIYGYLMSRRHVLISLERDILETYLSTKYLEFSSVAPHFFEPVSGASKEEIELDLVDFQEYWRFVSKMRLELKMSMKTYDYFAKLDYDKLSREGFIPEHLKKIIVNAAAEKKVRPLDINELQTGPSRVVRSNIDYATKFRNYNQAVALKNDLEKESRVLE